MARGTSKPGTYVEPAPDRALSPVLQLRLMQLERLDIGERVANAMDGR